MGMGTGRKRGGAGEDDGKEKGKVARMTRRREVWGQGRKGKGGRGEERGMMMRRRGAWRGGGGRVGSDGSMKEEGLEAAAVAARRRRRACQRMAWRRR